MEIKSLKNVKLDLPSFTCDTNCVNPNLEAHEALRTFNRYGTTLIIGAPGSGKSSVAVSLLTTKTKGSRVFNKNAEHFVIFVPLNSLHSMKKDPFSPTRTEDGQTINQVSMLFHELNYENLNTAYNAIQDWSEAGERTVIYIDDMTQDLKTHDNEFILNVMSLNRRHLKLNIIITSQTYRKIPITIRKSASTMILFHLPNKAENNAVFSEVLNISLDEWNLIYDHVYKRGKHNFLLLDVVNQKFFKNFEEAILLKSFQETNDSESRSDLEATRTPDSDSESD
jgi:hypothetical protein